MRRAVHVRHTVTTAQQFCSWGQEEGSTDPALALIFCLFDDTNDEYALLVFFRLRRYAPELFLSGGIYCLLSTITLTVT